jgi:hypothetical protein
MSKIVQAWADANGYRSAVCTTCQRSYLAAPGEYRCDDCSLFEDLVWDLVGLAPLHQGGAAGAVIAYERTAARYEQLAADSGDKQCAELAAALRMAAAVLRDDPGDRPCP